MTTGRKVALNRVDRVLMGSVLATLFALFVPSGFHLYKDNLPPDSTVAAELLAASEDRLAAEKDAAERRCLAEVIYYEARGEGDLGEKAVAEVVMARLKSRYYPKSICGVVHQGADRPGRSCQFSFACDGSMKQAKEIDAWD